MNIVKHAEDIATYLHSVPMQRRKYTGDPYIVHPGAVVNIIKSVPHNDEMLAAAWLHDVVEDTVISLGEINSEFGECIGSLVEMLTDVSKPEDGNRAIRKEIDRLHTAKASPEAQTIKLADLIDNSKSILIYDKYGFGRVFLKEMKQLLGVLTNGDKSLLDQAIVIVTNNTDKELYK